MVKTLSVTQSVFHEFIALLSLLHKFFRVCFFLHAPRGNCWLSGSALCLEALYKL